MTIWLDGDACPKQIRTVLYRAAERAKLQLIIVANHFFSVPSSRYIAARQVPSGFDAADNYITEHVNFSDLVITSDIPLSDAVISKGCTVITPRGQQLTHQNIKQHLTFRNTSEQLRGYGVMTGGPQPLNAKDIKQFSNHLDRFLAKNR